MIKIQPLSDAKANKIADVMTRAVTTNVSNLISQSTVGEPGTVVSRDIFYGYTKKDKDTVRADEFCRLGNLQLPVGIANPFYVEKTSMWAIALGLSGSVIKSILRGEVCYKVETSSLISTEFKPEVYYPEDYLFGGDCLEALLDKKFLHQRYLTAIFVNKVNPVVLSAIKDFEADLAGCKVRELDLSELAVKYIDKNEDVKDKLWLYDVYGLNADALRSVGLYELALEHSVKYHTFGDIVDYTYGSEEFMKVLASSEKEDREVHNFEDIPEEEEDTESYEDMSDVYDNYEDDSELYGDSDDSDDEEIKGPSEGRKSKVVSKASGVIHTQYERLGIFKVLDTEEGLKRLKNEIMHTLLILPIGYRPGFMGKYSDYSILYNLIEQKAASLKEAEGRLALDSAARIYNQLYLAIKCLFVGDSQMERTCHLKNFRSLSGLLKSKTGIIRSALEGSRFDYTARSVITSDPDMPYDSVGIPLDIIAATFEPVLVAAFIKAKDGYENVNAADITTQRRSEYYAFIKEYLKNHTLYGNVGRQPTLHYLGIQPYKVRISPNDTIVLSPLNVVAFNADFDGDQMHFEPILTQEAVDEITSSWMYSMPRRWPNGDTTVAPRLEVTYGLFLAANGANKTFKEENKNYTLAGLQQLLDLYRVKYRVGLQEVCYSALAAGIVSPSDTVDGKTLGEIAIAYVVSDSTDGTVPESIFKKKATKSGRLIDNGKVTIEMYKTYGKNHDKFTSRLTYLVKLGNGIAKRYSPSLVLHIDKEVTDKIQALVDKFNYDAYRKKHMVDLGLTTIEQYDYKYTEAWSALQKKVDELLAEGLSSTNGYKAMVDTGAKGDADNLRQIFGVKGRIEQVLDRPFNCIVRGSYARHLTGLEHFFTAYGARKGLEDKVLSTSAPGYLSRKLEHAGATQSTVTEDCGTTKGLLYTILDIIPFTDDQHQELDWHFEDEDDFALKTSMNAGYSAAFTDAVKYAANYIKYRNCVVDGKSVFVENENIANEVIRKSWGVKNSITHSFVDGKIEFPPIIVRSPVTCECPVCAACYGKDWTEDLSQPDIGKQVGFISAQAISEPGTQMTMKNFQKGGISTGKNLTSSFTLIGHYFDMHNFANDGKPITYDPIAPATGRIVEQYLSDGTKVVNIIDKDGKSGFIGSKPIMDSVIELKKYVHKGESICKYQGNLDPIDVLKYRGPLSLLSYLALKLTDIYKSKNVHGIYIEIILSAMVLGRISADLTIEWEGQKVVYPAGTMVPRDIYYACPEEDRPPVQWSVFGINSLPKYRPDILESMILENIGTYLPKAAITCPVDRLSNPISRIAFGQRLRRK